MVVKNEPQGYQELPEQEVVETVEKPFARRCFSQETAPDEFSNL